MSMIPTIQKIIAENAVVIYSKTYCPYCTRAKNLLASLLKSPALIIELDKVPDGSAIQNALQEMTKQRTVPNIFIHGKHVGGCDDVHALHQQGKLVPMLEMAI